MSISIVGYIVILLIYGIEVLEFPNTIKGRPVTAVDLSEFIYPTTYSAGIHGVGTGKTVINGAKHWIFSEGIRSVSLKNGGVGDAPGVRSNDLRQIDLPSTIESFDSGYWKAFDYNGKWPTVFVHSGCKSLIINKEPKFKLYSCWDYTLPSTLFNFQCENSNIIDFYEGKHPDLVIPEDKWGAKKITINGVEQ